MYTQNVGLVKEKKVILHYHEWIPFVSTVGASTNAVYNMMSIFDPNNSGIGHQPLGHDDWSNFYKEYQVIGSKATFTFHNVGTGTIPVRVGVIGDADGTISSVLSTKVERGGNSHSSILTTNSRERATISFSFDPKKAFDKTQLRDGHQMRATMSGNPTLGYFAVPWVQSIDEATTSATVGCDIKISYVVLLKDPIDLVGS